MPPVASRISALRRNGVVEVSDLRKPDWKFRPRLLEEVWNDDYSGIIDQISEALISQLGQEVHWESYERVMETNPALRDSVGRLIDVAIGLSPEGDISKGEIALDVGLAALPVELPHFDRRWWYTGPPRGHLGC